MTEFQNLVAFTGHFKNQDEMSDWLFKRHLTDGRSGRGSF